MGKIKKKKDDYFTGGYVSSSIGSVYLEEPSYIDSTMLNDYYTRVVPPYSSLTGSWGNATIIYGKDAYITDFDGTGKLKITGSTYEEIKERMIRAEVGDMNIEKIQSSRKEDNIIVCQNKEDLSVDKVLKTLSAVKGRLMIEIAPVHIKKIECRMSPAVRDNIIKASKKLKMYGKNRPIIVCYDEWGNRLPDTINLDSMNGIDLFIVDPKEYNEYYLEMNGIELPAYTYATSYNPSAVTYNADWWSSLTDDSIPF